MKIRLPEWLFKDPLVFDTTNKELSSREAGQLLAMPLVAVMAPLEVELELSALVSEQRTYTE